MILAGLSFNLRKVGILFCAIAIATVFLLCASYFSATETRIARDSRVVNLTEQQFTSWYQFFSGPECVDSDCLLTSVAANWKSAQFPTVELKDLPGYPAHRLDNDHGVSRILYRFDFDRRRHFATLLQHGDAAFTPYYVNHSHYDVFVNNEFRDAQRGTAPASIPVINIRDQDWSENGQASVLIVAEIRPGDTGIVHFGPMLTGPVDVLQGLYIANDRMNVSYYLLFMVAKGSILFLFLILALYASPYVGQGSFLIFALACFAEEWVRSDVFFITDSPSIKAQIFFAFRILGGISLYGILRSHLKKSWHHGLAVVIASGVSVFAWILFDAATAADGIPQILLALKVCTLWTLCICIDHIIQSLRDKNAEPKVLRLAFVAIYASVLLIELLFTPYQGFELRAVADLVFFVWAAVDAGVRYARNERTKTELQHQLVQASLEAAVGQLTQTLAHEVRKPLYLFRNLADIFEESVKVSPAAATLLLADFRKEFADSIIHVDRLLDEVLISTRRVNLTGSQQHVETILQASLKGLHFYDANQEKFVVSDTGCVIWGDEYRLVRLFQNLIENAWQAAPDKIVDIRSCMSLKKSGFVEVTISNDGEIADDVPLERIFEPGFSTKRTGHGLGLSIVKKIAIDHDGDAACWTADGKTHFTVTLPSPAVGSSR